MGHNKRHLPAIHIFIAVRLIPIFTHLSSGWTVPLRRIVMLAAPILINRSMTNYCACVSRKGNIIIQDGGQLTREMDIYHHGPGPISIICQLPCPPCFSLVTTFKELTVLPCPPTASFLQPEIEFTKVILTAVDGFSQLRIFL